MVLENILAVAESLDFDKEKLNKHIQKRYELYLRDWDIDSIKRLQEVTGIKPQEDIVQKTYLSHLWSVNSLEELEEVTGIKPKIPEKRVQEKYTHMLNYNNWDADDLKVLQKLTGAIPKIPEKKVQERYAYMIGVQGGVDEMKEVWEITGIKPYESTIQKRYAKLAERGQGVNLKELYEATEIKPKLTKKAVQEGYINCINNGGRLADFKAFYELMKIEPSKEVCDKMIYYLLYQVRDAGDEFMFHSL